MKGAKMLAILVVVLGLMVPAASVAEGAQYLTVNGEDVTSITVELGQSRTVEIVSTDSSSYAAYVGFDNGLVLGSFSHLETKDPEAGNLAAAAEYNQPAFYGYYVNAAGFDPPPSAGVHFVFEYTAQQVGETDVKLYDETRSIVIDSVHITVVPAKMGTAFTYQGRLIDANNTADGLYDFEFKLYDNSDPNIGTQKGSTIDINELDVIDGYFTVELDFGSGIYDGNAVWLEIGVRPGDSNDPNDFVTLSPRQEVTPVPYALQTRGLFVSDANNVGIGTTGPTEKLDVVGNVIASMYYDRDNTSYYVDPANSDTSARFAGKVGIGTTNPDRNLDIRHSNTGGGIEIDRTANNIWSGLVYENNGAENWFVGVQADSDDLLFKDNAAGVSMVIEDGTGNVGIGTTSPTSKLHVEGTIEVDQKIQADDSGGLEFATDDGTTRLKISDNGRVGIGTTNPSQMLEVAGYVMADRYIDMNTSYYLNPDHYSVCKFIQATAYFDKDDTSYYVAPGSTSTSARLRGDLYVSGAAIMTDVYNTNLSGKSVYVNSSGRLGSLSSSKRYKENIAPIQDDTSKILQAQPVTFTWKESKERGIGLIAEDMDELGLRNLVIYDNEGRPDSIRYEFISLYLLEVAKEQTSSIKELKAENESLKEQLRAENRSLKQRLDALEKIMRQQQFANGKEF